MRSKRVAQACDLMPGRPAVLIKARHALGDPTSFALRIHADATVELHRGVMAKVPTATATATVPDR